MVCTNTNPRASSLNHSNASYALQLNRFRHSSDAPQDFVLGRLSKREDAPSSRLSPLGDQFVRISVHNHTRCRQFLSEHPEILNENTGSYLAEALSAIREATNRERSLALRSLSFCTNSIKDLPTATFGMFLKRLSKL